MKFLILSRMMAQDANYVQAKITEPYFWISIFDVDKYRMAISEDPNCKASIFLAFDDLEGDHYDIEKIMGRPIELITDEQAQYIVGLANDWKDKIDLCLVNCEAGISRSSGVALGLSMLINGHDDGIRSNAKFHPNMFVRDKIIKNGEEIIWERNNTI